MSTPDPARAPGAVRTGTPPGPGPRALPERVVEALLAHPAVAALSGGPYGTVASYLPGRRLPGVVIGEGDEPTRVAVVLHFGAPVAATAAELRRIVAAMTGARRVDVVVADLEMPA